jgi:hypothetical protein
MALIKPKQAAIVKVQQDAVNPMSIKLSYNINPTNRIQNIDQVGDVTDKTIPSNDYINVVMSFLNRKAAGSASSTEYTVLKYIPVDNKFLADTVRM